MGLRATSASGETCGLLTATDPPSPTTSKRPAILLLLAPLLAVPPGCALGNPYRAPQELSLKGGGFDVGDYRRTSELGAELLFEPWHIHLVPHVGALVNGRGAGYVYTGLSLPVELGWGWMATGQGSAGLYDNGNGRDLGGMVEFRSGLEIARRLSQRHRLGIGFYHISNIANGRNPGVESLVLSWTFALGR